MQGEDGVEALDVTDAAAVERACHGVDAVVRLGGIASEGRFEDVLAVNVRGTERIRDAESWAGSVGEPDLAKPEHRLAGGTMATRPLGAT